MRVPHVPFVFRLTLCLAVAGCSAASAAANPSGTFVASNCAPMAAASDGTMLWYSKNSAGLWDAYIGNGNCQGQPLLSPYSGNRGPSDITGDGRYVLLTTAVGWDRALPDSSPGRGSQNAIQLYDRQTGKLSTLLASATTSQRGVILPKLNSDGTKIVWSQMVKTPAEAPPAGEWALHVADVDLNAGTLSNNVEWQDPDGQPAFYETYGWVPNTNLLIFMSTTRSTGAGFGDAQLFTLPEDLDPNTAPTRISPPFAPVWPWQSAVDVYHEFASFAPDAPTTLYTSIGADTVGGDDLFSYDMRSRGANGLLGQPTRISYFGGDMDLNGGTQAIPGWPQPSYTVVGSMAWVNGAWVATTCPDLLCSSVNAWRITLTEPTAGAAPLGSGAPPLGSGVTVLGSPPSTRSGSSSPTTASTRRPRRHRSPKKAGHRSTSCSVTRPATRPISSSPARQSSARRCRHRCRCSV